MGRTKLSLSALLCAVVLVGCGGTYEVPYVANSSRMSPRTAQEAVRTELVGREVSSWANGAHRQYRVNDVRMRPDGVGLLWREGRDPGIMADRLAYDGAASLKLCYYSQIKETRVISEAHLGADTGYWVFMCDVGLLFFNLQSAEYFADALFTLKQTSQ